MIEQSIWMGIGLVALAWLVLYILTPEVEDGPPRWQRYVQRPDTASASTAAESGDDHRVVADNNNGATPTNGVATPATAYNVLLSPHDAATLASDPKVDPVDVILWEGRADALAALVAAGALKVTETEAATLIYGIKPSGTSPRWKLVRAAIDAAKARRAPPRYQSLDDHRKPILQDS